MSAFLLFCRFRLTKYYSLATNLSEGLGITYLVPQPEFERIRTNYEGIFGNLGRSRGISGVVYIVPNHNGKGGADGWGIGMAG